MQYMHIDLDQYLREICMTSPVTRVVLAFFIIKKESIVAMTNNRIQIIKMINYI